MRLLYIILAAIMLLIILSHRTDLWSALPYPATYEEPSLIERQQR